MKLNELIKKVPTSSKSRNKFKWYVFHVPTNSWMTVREFRKVIKSEGLTEEMYYNTYIDDGVHKCENPECSNHNRFLGILNGYSRYCSVRCRNIMNSSLNSDKISESLSNTFKNNPEIIKSIKEKRSKTYKNPDAYCNSAESKNKRKLSSIKKWRNEDYRENQLNNNPIFSGGVTTSVSKESMKFIGHLLEKLDDKFSQSDLYYGDKEYIVHTGIEYGDICRVRKLDFYVKSINKAIEFYGDYWHGNYSEKYHKSIIDNPSPSSYYEEDKLRNKCIQNSIGCDILVVWEGDYKRNPEKVLDKCIRYLTTKKKIFTVDLYGFLNSGSNSANICKRYQEHNKILVERNSKFGFEYINVDINDEVQNIIDNSFLPKLSKTHYYQLCSDIVRYDYLIKNPGSIYMDNDFVIFGDEGVRWLFDLFNYSILEGEGYDYTAGEIGRHGQHSCNWLMMRSLFDLSVGNENSMTQILYDKFIENSSVESYNNWIKNNPKTVSESDLDYERRLVFDLLWGYKLYEYTKIKYYHQIPFYYWQSNYWNSSWKDGDTLQKNIILGNHFFGFGKDGRPTITEFLKYHGLDNKYKELF